MAVDLKHIHIITNLHIMCNNGLRTVYISLPVYYADLI